jgi:radical SAM protein with 4Fe4S-binding SPASM domain
VKPVLKELIIETWTGCNANCAFCIRREFPIYNQPDKLMSRDLFTKIVDQLPDGFRVMPQLLNEPLRNPDILWYLSKLERQNVNLYTNCAHLTEEMVAALVELPQIKNLFLSFHAADPEIYERVMNIPFQPSYEGAKRLLASKPERLNVAVMSWYLDWYKESAEKVPDLFPEADGYNVGRALDRGGRRGRVTVDKGTVCAYPFFSMTVLTDGTVTLCCQDPLPEYVLGNVNEQTVWEIWEDSRWDPMREVHLSGDVTRMRLCQYCTSADQTLKTLREKYL